MIIFILIEYNIFNFACKAPNSYDLLPIRPICWGWCAACQIIPVQGLKDTTINDFFMLQPGFTYEQVQQVQVQLNLQILNCCSRAAVHESVRNTSLTNFNSFRVFRGLSTQNWMLVTIWCPNHMQMVVHIGHVIIVVYKLQHCDSRDKEVIYCDVKKTVFFIVLLRFYPIC